MEYSSVIFDWELFSEITQNQQHKMPIDMITYEYIFIPHNAISISNSCMKVKLKLIF